MTLSLNISVVRKFTTFAIRAFGNITQNYRIGSSHKTQNTVKTFNFIKY